MRSEGDLQSYLVQFADVHHEFRLPELQSLADLHALDYVTWDAVGSSLSSDPLNPFVILWLKNDRDASCLVQRSVLIRSIWALWSLATTFEDLHASTKSECSRRLWKQFQPSIHSYRFSFHSHNRRYEHDQNVSRVEDFKYMQFEGPIKLSGQVSVELGLLEYWKRLGREQVKETATGTTWTDESNCKYELAQVALGKLVAHSWRKNIARYNLRDRQYIGNTSMEPMLSFLLSNLALVRPGIFAFDPFIGTGSLMLSAAVYGANVAGTDIDGRQIRGNRPSSRSKSSKAGVQDQEANLLSSAKQYGIEGKMLDFVTCDLANNPWHRAGKRRPLFDVIISDPPYGVRAGGKQLGTCQTHAHSKTFHSKRDLSQKDLPGHDRYPPTQPYPLSQIITDLLVFARCHLVNGGRLVYLLPQPLNGKDEEVPSLPGLKVIHAPSQPMGRWCRRAIVMERLDDQLDEELPKVVSGIDRLCMSDSNIAISAIAESRPTPKVGSTMGTIPNRAAEFRDQYFRAFGNGMRVQANTNVTDLP